MAKSEVMGIGDLKQRFGQLKSGMETRTSRLMVVAAGGVLKAKAKSIAQANGSVRTGAMVKNIVIKREPQAPSGTTQYNLGVRHGRDLTKKQKTGGKHLAVTGGGRISVRYHDDPYYWKWVEQGHKIVPRKAGETGATGQTVITYTRKGRSGKMVTYTRKRGTDSLRARRQGVTGSVPAKPFIGPAAEQGREQAITAMGERLQKELDKAAQA
ncbi:phage protein, HK97 gp10 family [Polaromonas sp. OV174]|uniref:HK97-gp10 family putative phage morphogenesis protein n=1 Tax=Polaromonas sp. OV174 TaxID=1855300 RepID=UPI0008F2456E|nr:HK97-gp10 family putative phage morphogenesis protein [Polaromonas sp. OV174]SFB96635.1 phage protein, HK97 gp10 family [Polaromonas sp. OV174]